MSDSDFQGTIKRLPEPARERLKLGARERFILLFALFNAMFCLLFVLLLQNRQYADHIEMIEATATEEAIKVTTQKSEIEALEDKVSTLEDKISELLFPTPTPTVASPTADPAPNPPTSTLPATVTPSPVPPPPCGTPTPVAHVYGLTATCSISVANCKSAAGAPDGGAGEIYPGGVITLDMGIGNGITDGGGDDFVFYEWWNPSAEGVFMDYVVIELSEDGSTWYQVFNWGDGYNYPMDEFAGIITFSSDDDGEVNNELIPSALLYGISPTPPHPSGILIDIGFLGRPTGVAYRYIRISCPYEAGDPVQVDAVEGFH